MSVLERLESLFVREEGASSTPAEQVVDIVKKRLLTLQHNFERQNIIMENEMCSGARRSEGQICSGFSWFADIILTT